MPQAVSRKVTLRRAEPKTDGTQYASIDDAVAAMKNKAAIENQAAKKDPTLPKEITTQELLAYIGDNPGLTAPQIAAKLNRSPSGLRARLQGMMASKMITPKPVTDPSTRKRTVGYWIASPKTKRLTATPPETKPDSLAPVWNRLLAYIAKHPGSNTHEIAAAFGRTNKRISELLKSAQLAGHPISSERPNATTPRRWWIAATRKSEAPE